MFKWLNIFCLCSVFASCFNRIENGKLKVENEKEDSLHFQLSIFNFQLNKLDSLGLVKITDIDSTICVELKYATSDNFADMILYHDFDEAYLQPDVAVMLSDAQKRLKSIFPDYSLLVYDAARPLSVQEAMWNAVKDTRFSRYVANPQRTSLHNYGAAVDVTIVNNNEIPLDMGTPFDFFGKAAGNYEDELIVQGILTPEHLQNRQLLRKVMTEAGFHIIRGEWWHFNACSLNEAKLRYELIP